MLKFRKPTLDDKELLDGYVKEHLDSGEHITAGFGIEKEDYSTWLKSMNEAEKGHYQDFGRCYLYLVLKGDELIGLLSIRPELTDELAESIGHIGYGVKPSERRKGYATMMLKKGLIILKQKGLKKAILGCYEDNIASARVMKNNGGQFYKKSDDYKKGKESIYYLFEL